LPHPLQVEWCEEHAKMEAQNDALAIAHWALYGAGLLCRMERSKRPWPDMAVSAVETAVRRAMEAITSLETPEKEKGP
jgi:hypothetical protein